MTEAGQFWAEPLEPAACRNLADKYERLFEAIATTPGSRQTSCLREAARRWPGSLREAQSVEPRQLQRRWDEARGGAEGEARRRSWWRDRGWSCLPLWAELHGLLADQLAWRQAQPDRVGALAEFLDGLRPEVRHRWPAEASILERRGGPRLVPIQAHRWLAVRIGWSVADLHRCLFTRVGRSARMPAEK